MNTANLKPEKIHVGLISAIDGSETKLKEALQQTGGGYVHTGRNHIEMYQKLGMQKIDILIYDCPPEETGAQAQSLVAFFRNKLQFRKLPIAIYVNAAQFELRTLITDTRVRGFHQSVGFFLMLTVLIPLINEEASKQLSEPLPSSWIETQFLEALKGRVGSQSQFSAITPNDEELHSAFLCQIDREIRSHLAWVKFGSRLLESQNDGINKLFKGLSKDAVEELSEHLMRQVMEEFSNKMHLELTDRGALFFPSFDSLTGVERKQLYGGSKSSAFLFRSEEISVLLEIIRYL